MNPHKRSRLVRIREGALQTTPSIQKSQDHHGVISHGEEDRDATLKSYDPHARREIVTAMASLWKMLEPPTERPEPFRISLRHTHACVVGDPGEYLVEVGLGLRVEDDRPPHALYALSALAALRAMYRSDAPEKTSFIGMVRLGSAM
jgi:hypothetical protein